MARASASPKNMVAACVVGRVLACRGGRSTYSTVLRRPSVCFGTCRLSGWGVTDGVDGSGDDHE